MPVRCRSGSTAIGPRPITLRSGWPVITTGENMMWPTTRSFSSATRETAGSADSRRTSTSFASPGLAKAATLTA